MEQGECTPHCRLAHNCVRQVGEPLGPRAYFDAGRLIVRGAQRDDAGRYVCVAEIRHHDGSSSTAEGYATVHVQPCK
jgi:hypothetical protein